MSAWARPCVAFIGDRGWSICGADRAHPMATSRKCDELEKRPKPAKTVAAGCHRLPIGAHGKEGVDGSSPSEGSAKSPHIGVLSFRSICTAANVRQVWSLKWSFRVGKLRRGLPILSGRGKRGGSIICDSGYTSPPDAGVEMRPPAAVLLSAARRRDRRRRTRGRGARPGGGRRPPAPPRGRARQARPRAGEEATGQAHAGSDRQVS
jgi:hypothetical protein